jgi:hypothetical protein
MEIIKQLYDIGNLVDNVTDLETIKTTFKKFAKTELAYREMDTLSDKDVLEDIYQTALYIPKSVTKILQFKFDDFFYRPGICF